MKHKGEQLSFPTIGRRNALLAASLLFVGPTLADEDNFSTPLFRGGGVVGVSEEIKTPAGDIEEEEEDVGLAGQVLLGVGGQQEYLALSFLESSRSGLRPDDAYSFSLRASVADVRGGGTWHGVYDRLYGGIPLLSRDVRVSIPPGGGEEDVELKFQDDEEYGHYLSRPFIPPASLEAKVRTTDVLNAIARERGASLGSEDFDYLEPTLGFLDAEEFGQEARLVYRVVPGPGQSLAAAYLVDASDGSIVDSWSTEENGGGTQVFDGHGVASPRNDHDRDGYGDRVPLSYEKYDEPLPSGDEYRLLDPSRGRSSVRSMDDKKKSFGYHGVYVYSDVADEWGNGNKWEEGMDYRGHESVSMGVDVLWGIEVTWDLLWNLYGLSSYDNSTTPIKGLFNYREKDDEPYSDAKYDGYFICFGNGDGTKNKTSNTPINTVGHEIGHALWRHWVQPGKDKGEARGLNEGHADILGTLVRHYAVLADGQGDEVPTHEGDWDARLWHMSARMVAPWAYRTDGDCEAGGGGCGIGEYPGGRGFSHWFPGIGDKEEHLVGCAYGHAIIIMAYGLLPSEERWSELTDCPDNRRCLGAHPHSLFKFPDGMAGIGMEAVAAMFMSSTLNMFHEPNFGHARGAWIKAAIEVHGENSAEHSAVQNSFWVINVGEYATDTNPPEGTVDVLEANDNERTISFAAHASDDTGVVLMQVEMIPGNVHGNIFNYTLQSTVDDVYEAPLHPGHYEVILRVKDQHANENEINMFYTFQDANRIAQWSFDSEGHGWTFNNGVTPHVGARTRIPHSQAFLTGGAEEGGMLVLDGQGNATVDVDVPHLATHVTVGCRLRINVDSPGLMELRLGNTFLLRSDQWLSWTVGEYTNVEFTIPNAVSPDPLPRGLQPLTFSVESIEDSYAFFVDRVYVVVDEPATADLDSYLDPLEGAVVLTSSIGGIYNHRLVHHVDVGSWSKAVYSYADVAMPVVRVESAEAFAGINFVQTRVVNYFGDVLASDSTHFVVETIDNLIENGGFESGTDHWTLEGDVEAIAASPDHPVFLGNAALRFNNDSVAEQPIVLPGSSAASSARLTLRLREGVNALDAPPPASGQLTIQSRRWLIGGITLLQVINCFTCGATREDEGWYKYDVDLTPLTVHGGVHILSLEYVRAVDGTSLLVDNVGVTWEE